MVYSIMRIHHLYTFCGARHEVIYLQCVPIFFILTDLPQTSSKKEHFFCYRFQVITSKSETIISILTPKNRSESSSAASQSRKM